MPIIEINEFKGLMPKIAVRKRPISSAVLASNARLISGNLEAWQGLLPVAGVLNSGIIRSIFLYEGSYWNSSVGDFYAIKSPIAQDPYKRIYGTDSANGGPLVAGFSEITSSSPYPGAAFELGIPAPIGQISGVVNIDAGADAEDFSDDETRFYVMTYVSAYGEEGAPGSVSAELTLESPSTETVNLTLPVPGVNNNNLATKRIYRTVTTGSSTEFFFVKEVAIGVTATTDDVASIAIGAVLSTENYDPPPSNMTGLVRGDNGIVVGFAGNEFMPSEAFLPYAYPVSYRLTTESDIMGVTATSNGFVVITKGYPYIITGVSPDSLIPEKLDIMQGCLASGSVVDMGEYAIYVSADGLVAAGNGRAELLTGSIASKEEWKDFPATNMHCYRYQDRYVGFYGDTNNDGSGTGGFIYDPSTDDLVSLDFYATAGFSDLESDTLYLVVDGNLVAFDELGTDLTYAWKSKIFRGDDMAFSCAKVYTETPADVGFKLWIDGALELSMAALTTEAFRIPSKRGTEWQFELSGTASIQKVAIATSMSELE